MRSCSYSLGGRQLLIVVWGDRARSCRFRTVKWPLIGRDVELDRALGLIRDGTGVAILGVAGVGKSRLFHELVDRASDAGFGVVSVVASESTRPIPFAPFVELLPGGPTPDELTMLGAARQALMARATEGGLVVAVDDAHHLDGMSLAFLVSIAASGIATVVLTARTSEPMESDLVDLWTNGVIARIDVPALDRAAMSELVGKTLGPVSTSLNDELWRLSHGNPLVLHEILEGAVGSTIRTNDEGIWVEDGPIARSPRLSDLVTSRMQALPDNLRAALELIALGSPLPIGLAQKAIGDDLGMLEERDLVEVAEATGERLVVPTHPLYGEILKEHLGTARSRSAFRRLVEAAVGSDAPIDPLRVSVWQRDGDHWMSDEIALAGAAEALMRHDPVLAGELLERLDPNDDRVGLLLGRSLSYRQQSEEAEAVLADRSPEDPALLTEIASVRGQNLAFGLGRVADARDVFAAESEKLADPDLRARLGNERAMVSAMHGDFADATQASRSVLEDPAASDVPRAAAYVTLTIALAMTADCDGMDSVLDKATAVAERVSGALPFARSQIGIMDIVSMVNSGHLDDAREACQSAIDSEQTSPAMLSTLLASQVLVLHEQGLLRQALDVGERALSMYDMSDPFGLESQTRGLLAATRGQVGDDTADSRLDELGDLAAFGPRITLWVDRGRAWVAATQGALDDAAQISLQSGKQGVAGEHFAWAAMCFHDAVRFGRPELVLDDLMAVDASRGAHYIAALQQHARASAESDRVGLDVVASSFHVMGGRILEAEVWAESTRLHLDAGDEVAAAIACVRSRAAEARCEDPETPALQQRPAVVSDREFEVALDAASGLTSPQIAEKRFISVRTVDNHLRSVYRKLDISGRDELPPYLVPDSGRQ